MEPNWLKIQRNRFDDWDTNWIEHFQKHLDIFVWKILDIIMKLQLQIYCVFFHLSEIRECKVGQGFTYREIFCQAQICQILWKISSMELLHHPADIIDSPAKNRSRWIFFSQTSQKHINKTTHNPYYCLPSVAAEEQKGFSKKNPSDLILLLHHLLHTLHCQLEWEKLWERFLAEMGFAQILTKVRHRTLKRRKGIEEEASDGLCWWKLTCSSWIAVLDYLFVCLFACLLACLFVWLVACLFCFLACLLL